MIEIKEIARKDQVNNCMGCKLPADKLVFEIQVSGRLEDIKCCLTLCIHCLDQLRAAIGGIIPF